MSRLFAAEVLEFPESDAEKISALMGASDLQELKLEELLMRSLH